MSHFAKIVLSAVLVLCGCASVQERQLRDRLVGSWIQRIILLGERKETVLILGSDGKFVETGTTINGTFKAAHIPQHGTWSVVGETLRLQYETGGAGTGSSMIEDRTVVSITDEEFVSADPRFGIQVRRARLVASGR